MWVAEKRAEATEYVAKLGLQDKFLYNSITPWDKDIKGQVQKLKDLGIKHVVVQAFDDQDQTPGGRLKSLEKLLDQGAGDFATVIVDTSVMNLPATSFSLIANRLIKEKLGLPCGGAYSNGTHMWKEAKTLWSLDGFRAMDAVVQGMSSVLWSDFNFYGPIVTAPRIFPAVAAAHILLTTLLYDETKKIADNPDLPIKKYFGDFLGKLTAGAARK
jgi:tetrahydromethanopterin S-methyltransferase subunit H